MTTSQVLDKGIIPVAIETEMRKSYLDYAMSVIVARAIPDACDGLKPVHRRILYAMHEGGYDYNKPFKKCREHVFCHHLPSVQCRLRHCHYECLAALTSICPRYV